METETKPVVVVPFTVRYILFFVVCIVPWILYLSCSINLTVQDEFNQEMFVFIEALHCNTTNMNSCKTGIITIPYFSNGNGQAIMKQTSNTHLMYISEEVKALTFVKAFFYKNYNASCTTGEVDSLFSNHVIERMYSLTFEN